MDPADTGVGALARRANSVGGPSVIGDLEISAPARRAFVIAGTRALSRIPSATRERGREYADEGRVSRVTATEDTISAIVTGSIPYTVVAPA